LLVVYKGFKHIILIEVITSNIIHINPLISIMVRISQLKWKKVSQESRPSSFNWVFGYTQNSVKPNKWLTIIDNIQKSNYEKN